MRVGSAPSADHLRRVDAGVRGGVAGPGVATGPGAVPSLAHSRRRAAGRRATGGDGGGGVYRLALRGRGDRSGRVRGARRRAGRHASGAWPQASSQDRPVRRPAVARVAAAWRAARVVDSAGARVGVARTRPAVQVAGRSTQGVDPTDPRRAVPARRRRAGGADPHTIDASVAGQQRGDVDSVGPAADRGRLLDDRRHRQRSAAAQSATAALRDAPAGMPGAGRASLRDRRPARGSGVVRTRRLSSLLALAAGGAPHRSGRRRRRVRSSSGTRLLVAARSVDVAVGAVRSGPQRVPARQPGSRLLLQGEGASRRQARGDLRRPPVRPALLPPAAQPGSRRRLRRRRLNTAGDDVPRRPRQHHQVSTAVSSRHAHARRSLAGRPSNTDATALPTGDTQITIVVADDTTFVEHLGNAGRPHAAVSRPIASLHRPSGPSRSFVLASLRALHLDRRLRPGAPRAKRALTTRAHTGNASSQRDRCATRRRAVRPVPQRGVRFTYPTAANSGLRGAPRAGNRSPHASVGTAACGDVAREPPFGA